MAMYAIIFFFWKSTMLLQNPHIRQTRKHFVFNTYFTSLVLGINQIKKVF